MYIYLYYVSWSRMHTDFSWLFSLPSVTVSVTHMNEDTKLQDAADQVTENVNQPFILLIIWINNIDKLNEVTNCTLPM